MTSLARSFLALVPFVALACGGTTTPDTADGTDSAFTDSSLTDGGGDAVDETIADSSADTTPTPGDVGLDVLTDGPSDAPSDGRVVCSSEPTRVKCDDCCQKEHKEGYATLTAALLACACTDALCKTVCASTACAATPSTPDAACKACLGEVGAKAPAGSDGGVAGKCNDSVTTACKTDPKCVAYAACLATCPGA